MNEKRKIIFKEALFNVPIILLGTVITLGFMFKSGRSPYDIEQLITKNFHSDTSLSAADFLKTQQKSYTVTYYYGDDDNSVRYAQFVYEGKGDNPQSTLTLYEARDGFDPGEYSVLWFMGKEYVTYTPPNSSVESEGFEQYFSYEVPLMYNLVNSYSWDGAMLANGAADQAVSGFSVLGVKLFVWDYSDNGVMRQNFLWGIGGNPREMYSYIHGSNGEYKRLVLSK